MAKQRQNEEPLSDQEGEQIEARLQQLAEEWRRKLADPAFREAQRLGLVSVSPLVTGLLSAFPRA